MLACGPSHSSSAAYRQHGRAPFWRSKNSAEQVDFYRNNL
jgi:hypothetical protein